LIFSKFHVSRDAENGPILPAQARRDASFPYFFWFKEIINGDPAASPLCGAHRLDAPYSSHYALQGYISGFFSPAALLGGHVEHPSSLNHKSDLKC
jgi:hypothetical protein